MAYYLSPLDLLHLQSYPHQLKFLRPPCTLVPLSPSSPSTPVVRPSPASPAEQFDVFASYALVFDYGAIVFFNVSESAQLAFFDSLPNRPASRLKDDYTITLNSAPALQDASPASPTSPSSPLQCHFGPDSLHLSSLDCYSVRMIAQILAQTVALEAHEQRTAAMLSEFHALSMRMQATGSLPHSSSAQLVQLLAANNLILTTVLTHLRLLDRSEIAWRYGRYDPLWQGMRHEFEVEPRYETLTVKLRLLHDSNSLFLDVLNHQKSTRLEWIIIALIAIEVVIAVLRH